ncbi:MAG: peptide chain release factor N(5)-glutamine methyltransferase [Alphaproteobacteria bacterium]|nr:peptide chain release factor N(5)-glutamine methyltransferase [Alphaproteobacteria bacterium]
MKLAPFIASVADKLKEAGIDNAALDARLLAGHALGLDRAALLSQSERDLSEQEMRSMDALIMRRSAREPVGRILGHREFWGMDFALNEATLEPRPDSETLVEAAVKLAVSRKNDALQILDLGTGTGCLLLALLHEFPNAAGLGIDLAPRAVEQATTNAATLGFASRATFQTGDWFTGLERKFDIIACNPPYIPAFDIAQLMPEVRDHDPFLALDGGTDGVTPYHLLIPVLPVFMNRGGIAAFEVGQGQAEEVVDLFLARGFSDIAAHKDLGGIERVVTATI